MMQAVTQEVRRLGHSVEDVQQSVETILEKLQSWNNQPPITNTKSDCDCKGQIKDVLERMDQLEAEKIQMQATLTDITKKIVVINRVREFDIEPHVTSPQVKNNKRVDDKPDHTSSESQFQEHKRDSSNKTPGLPDQSNNRMDTFNQPVNVKGAHTLDIETDSNENLNKSKDKHETHEREPLLKYKTTRPQKKIERDIKEKQESSKEVVVYSKTRIHNTDDGRRPVRSEQKAIALGNDIETDSNEEVDSEMALVIRTPNAQRIDEDNEEEEVTVVHQTNKHNYVTHAIWNIFSHEESRDAEQSGLKDLGGIHSIICVDISESMAEGGAWKQARTFFKNYINGLEHCRDEHNMKEEHVALVTFGNQTKVMQRLTNDFGKLKEAFNTIKLGGPSPMYGGTMMAFAAVESCDLRVTRLLGTDMQMNSKIIFITDGHPTEGTLCQGPDKGDPDLEDKTKSKILDLMGNLQRVPVDIYCVPVGDNANKEFLQSIVDVGDGRMLEYTDGTKMSRRLYLSFNVDPSSFGLLGRWFVGLPGLPGLHGDRHNQFSPEDRQHMMEIWDDDRKNCKKTAERRRALEANYYGESDSQSLLPVGTRVRRGPDWCYSNCDENGPGTVIGHQLDADQVNVEWDLPKIRAVYNYGVDGHYDVIAVDEARLLTQGQTIAVGCIVKPGQRRNLGVSRDIKGIVIKVLNQGNQIEVRWNTGKRGTFSYGENGIYDVVLCQDIDLRRAIEDVTSQQTPPLTQQQTTRQASKAALGSSQPNKNKNKNI